MPAETQTPSLVNNFLDLLGGDWAYALPLKTQWTVVIQPDAGNNLFSIIGDYTDVDVHNFKVSPSIQTKLLNNKTQPNIDGLGLYFAQSVKMPKESFTVGSAGVDGMAGYLKGSIAGDRLDNIGRHLNIDFLETNVDFVEGLIRPWIIAASYKGLIDIGTGNSIKSTITVREFTRESGKSKKPERINHIFTGCVPIDIPEKILKYDTEEPLINSVSWIYNHYTYVVDPATNRT